jgi:hypothetical protein
MDRLAYFGDAIRLLNENAGAGQVIDSSISSNLPTRFNHIAFTATYKTARGKPKPQSFTYDLKLTLGLGGIVRKTINDIDRKLETIGRELSNASKHQKDMVNRLEWAMLTPSNPSNPVKELNNLLIYLRNWWLDYRELGSSAYSGYSLFQMRTLCERTHDILCRSASQEPGQIRLRQLLLRLARMRFWGQQSVDEINKIGSEIVAIAERLSSATPPPSSPFATSGRSGLIHRLLRR